MSKFRLIRSEDYYSYSSFKKYVVQKRGLFGWRNALPISIDCSAGLLKTATPNDLADDMARQIFDEFVKGNGAFVMEERSA